MADSGIEGGDDVWERVASAWERNRERMFDAFRSASEWIIDQLDPRPGQAILEIAAGPGETGFLAAERVGPTGRVISTDLAPSMVEAARRGVEARRLGNVECRVMDAQRIDLPDHSVDGTISRLGFMLVPDPVRAFGEVRRVLRPSGRLVYAVMGPPDRNPWVSVLAGALMQQGHRTGGDNPFALGGVFGLSAPEVNEELVGEAGFTDVRAEELAGLMSYDSIDQYWDMQSAVGGPQAAILASLSPGEVASVRATVDQLMPSFESGGRYDLPTLLVVVAAS